MNATIQKITFRFKDSDNVTVYLEAELKDGRFSISGEYGSEASGQIQDNIDPKTDAQKELVEIWNRWHLNDMKAGCEHQRAEKWKDARIDPKELPDSNANRDERGILAIWVDPSEHKDGLLTKPCPVCGYRYGSKWLREELPADLWDRLERIRAQIVAEEGPDDPELAALPEHERRAVEFLRETNTTMEAVFSRYDKHFDDDDEEKRDIYKITLKRGSRSFSFEFGQSINASGRWICVGDFTKHERGDRVNTEKRPLGFAENWKRNESFAIPDAYTVLSGLTKYDPGTLEQFCSDCGYDTDSKRAEKTYKAVLSEWANVQKLWSDEEIERLGDIH